MGNLSQYADQIKGVGSELKSAKVLSENIDSIIEKRFDAASGEMVKSLKKLISDSTQDSVFSNSVHQAVLSISQNNQMLMGDLTKDMRKLVVEVDSKQREFSKAVSAELESVNRNVNAKIKSLEGSVSSMEKNVGKLPQQFPIADKVDLSGLVKDIAAVRSAVASIPTAKIPKPQDLTPQLKALEKKMSSRVHAFDVIRDEYSGLVKRITVKVK